MSRNAESINFKLADGYEYSLGRNYAAASRLNFQYYLWKESLKFNIHPSIRVPLENARVADVATGTAIWLTDLAQEFPKAQLDGFDINLAQAPPKEWLPPNVRLSTWDVFEDVPEYMLGIYDIVHVRLLVLVVRDSNPRNVIRNLAKMLKPGGYIQWDDLDYPGTHVRKSVASLCTPGLDKLRKMVYSEGRNDWTLELAKIFSEQGLLNTSLNHYEDSLRLAKANGEQHLLTMEEFASSLAQTNRVEEASEIIRLIHEVQAEVSEGAVLSMPRVVCVGEKPNTSAATSPWYKQDIGPRLKPNIRAVFEIWSGLTGDELVEHLHKIRDKAWPHGKYPCIGEWIFLLPSISAFPQYPGILARAQVGATVLDLGCCFGQDLRLLAAGGALTTNMYASDISHELWNLGFELFRDRDKMKAVFIEGDFLRLDSELCQLNGQIDIIISCQFLHLFDWDKQVVAIKRIIELSRPGSVVIGYQRAQLQAQEIARPWGQMYFHNAETFREIWRQAEAGTGSRWQVQVALVDLTEWGMEQEDFEWMPEGRRGINFVVVRQS